MILLAGLGISYGGSELATANLETIGGSLEAGTSLEATLELSPEFSADGVYAVKSVGDEHSGITLHLADPDGITVDTLEIQGDAGESEFVVSKTGKYVLEAQNTSDGKRDIVIAVGYKPDESAKFLVVVGMYVIIAGMIAMLASIAYFVIASRIKR